MRFAMGDKPQGNQMRPRPPMRGRYLVRSLTSALLLSMVDLIFDRFRSLQGSIPDPLDSILLANWAHLGDLVLSLPAMDLLRDRFPNARIGIIVGSWAAAALKGTGLVDEVYTVDHWKLNRASTSGLEKFSHYVKTRRIALREIIAAKYEVGLDLYPFFPPASPLFYLAGIPNRIGFTSGGFGGLLTHPKIWPNLDRHVIHHARELLLPILPDAFECDLRPCFPGSPQSPVPSALLDVREYVLLHMGAGTPNKEWHDENWKIVIQGIASKGLQIVITGSGKVDQDRALNLKSDFPGIINLVNRTDLSEFVSVVAHAKLLVCLDTATAHIAAAFSVPTVCLFTGTNNLKQWHPLADTTKVLINPVPCMPCYRPGCFEMACIKGIQPTDVLRNINAFL